MEMQQFWFSLILLVCFSGPAVLASNMTLNLTIHENILERMNDACKPELVSECHIEILVCVSSQSVARNLLKNEWCPSKQGTSAHWLRSAIDFSDKFQVTLSLPLGQKHQGDEYIRVIILASVSDKPTEQRSVVSYFSYVDRVDLSKLFVWTKRAAMSPLKNSLAYGIDFSYIIKCQTQDLQPSCIMRCHKDDSAVGNAAGCGPGENGVCISEHPDGSLSKCRAMMCTKGCKESCGEPSTCDTCLINEQWPACNVSQRWTHNIKRCVICKIDLNNRGLCLSKSCVDEIHHIHPNIKWSLLANRSCQQFADLAMKFGVEVHCIEVVMNDRAALKMQTGLPSGHCDGILSLLSANQAQLLQSTCGQATPAHFLNAVILAVKVVSLSQKTPKYNYMAENNLESNPYASSRAMKSFYFLKDGLKKCSDEPVTNRDNCVTGVYDKFIKNLKAYIMHSERLIELAVVCIGALFILALYHYLYGKHCARKRKRDEALIAYSAFN